MNPFTFPALIEAPPPFQPHLQSQDQSRSQQEETTFPPLPPQHSTGNPPLAPPVNTPAQMLPSIAPQPPLSAPDIEKLVKGEVEKALKKMVQNMLPDLAEKIIKDEIFKILSQD